MSEFQTTPEGELEVWGFGAGFCGRANPGLSIHYPNARWGKTTGCCLMLEDVAKLRDLCNYILENHKALAQKTITIEELERKNGNEKLQSGGELD